MARDIFSGTSGTAAASPSPLSPAEILALHDAGAGLGAIDRALLALSFCSPEGADSAFVPLGIRDRVLLDLHRVTFGPVFDAVATCPGCAEQLHVPLDAAALVVEAAPDASPEIQIEDWRVTVRPLDTADLLRAAACKDSDAAARALASAAIVSATQGGKRIAADDLPAAITVAAGEAVAALDPMAETVLDVACPACDSVTPLALDVSAFLWRAIDQTAASFLDEVATLAGRYGWSERDVLAMSPHRRLHYLAAAE